MVPNAIHCGTPGQRVVRMREPMRQRGAAGALVVPIREVEPRRQCADKGECTGRRRLQRLVDVAASEELHRARRAGRLQPAVGLEIIGGCVNQRRFRQRGQFSGYLLLQMEGGKGQALIVAPLRRWRCQDPLDIGR